MVRRPLRTQQGIRRLRPLRAHAAIRRALEVRRVHARCPRPGRRRCTMNARSALWAVAGLLTIGLALELAVAVPSNAVAQVEDVRRVFAEQLDSSGVPGGA